MIEVTINDKVLQQAAEKGMDAFVGTFVNAILDAIDKNEGYCPCQMQCLESKCHCKDFLENKKIGEPCICNIFVKVKK
jgi:hypothetical protein